MSRRLGDGFLRRYVEQRFASVGIAIDGSNPWDLHVSNPLFFRKLLCKGSLGLGESYMDGWWECEQIDELACRLVRSASIEHYRYPRSVVAWIEAKLFNLQSKQRAFYVGKKHYDIGTDLYAIMLDERMVYSCGYWANADNLVDAQQHKLDLICRKLDLQKGMRILDLGCGWGSFAKYAAQVYGVEVVGITISKEQFVFARENCRGLAVEIRLQDYRDVDEQFDAIVSVGMFEHVGRKNYSAYMQCIKRCLLNHGRHLLHTIGTHIPRLGVNPWIARYIFPNGELPSLANICEALDTSLWIEDVHNFGPDYDTTLMHWWHNFDAGWSQLQGKYDDRFYRMWKYYLLTCAGAFRTRKLQLWQVVISHQVEKVYRRPA